MGKEKSKNPAINFIAGGTAGMCEALTCHPLDTIKVRMQLARRTATSNSGTAQQAIKAAKRIGFVGTGIKIIKKETPLGLYKGLGAVLTGITPKMAIRFTSYSQYSNSLRDANGHISSFKTFLAGVGAGITEAVLVVNPLEVIKIRLQAQSHSMADPVNTPRYRNAAHCLGVTIKEEGFGALYRGVSLTAARQAINQGVNYMVYENVKSKLYELQPEFNGNLPIWQTLGAGFFSGSLGPLCNAPLDTIKTRMQRESGASTESGLSRVQRITTAMIREEGMSSLYRGVTPRILRVAPGQSVVFVVYEHVRQLMEDRKMFQRLN